MAPVPAIGSATLTAARTLEVDRVTAEVVAALRTARVRSILIKGPAIARLLYEREPRGYVDSDLLVAPGDIRAAEEVLTALSFEERPVRIEPALGPPHARTWTRASDGATVDLHRILAGVGTAPHELWDEMSRMTVTGTVARIEVEMPRPGAQALIVTLHAAQHGPDVAKPLEDLRRAVRTLPDEVWREAAALAGRLDASISFAAGLRYVPEGAALAARLGLPSAGLVEASRRAGSPTRMALGFERLASARGARAKLTLLAAELAPSPRHMRWWFPLARRGRGGLAAAYAWRALLLIRHAPPSLLAWLRHTRGGR